MAGLETRIELDETLSAGLSRAIAAGNDLTPAMMAIANHLAATTRYRFETQSGPDGRPWKPSRRVIEEGGETLTLSGDLRGSIAPRWGKDFAEAGPERSGGAAVYAASHQFGGRITPKKGKALSFGGRLFAAVTMPARPYLGADERNRAAIVEILRDFLAGALGGSGAPA
jgi:phage virion morphogenesis protein